MREDLHWPVCQFLEQTEHEDGLLLMFRGGLKTSLATVGRNLWFGSKNPELRILIASNIIDNAAKMVWEIRQKVMTRRLYQILYPEVIPNFRKVKWSDRAACLNRNGEFPESTFEAAGLGTTLTSRHYDMICEDDTVCAKKDDFTGQECMPTQEDIEKAIAWHKFRWPFYVDASKGRDLVVGTRWADKDLGQFVIDRQEDTIHTITPVLNEQGESVYPSKLPVPLLNKIRREVGSYIFSSQYLLNPLDPERLTFRKDLLRYWARGEGENPKVKYIPSKAFDAWWQGLRRALLIDPAVGKAKKVRRECDSALEVVGVDEENFRFVLDCRAETPRPDALIRMMIEMVQKWSLQHIVIEEVGFQEALKFMWDQEAPKHGLQGVYVETISPGTRISKDTRIQGLQPWFHGGALRIGLGMAQLEHQITTYPFCDKVDLLDALYYMTRIWKGAPPKVKVEATGTVWVEGSGGELLLDANKAIDARKEELLVADTQGYLARVP